MIRFAVVQSQFNEEITGGLLQGATQFLKKQGVEDSQIDIYPASGAFEIPLIAKKLAKSGRYQGIIGLGCVIKGETAHFEFISLASTMGIMNAMLETETPISFGILTVYNQDQALDRIAEGKNKGIEAAAACYELFRTLRQIEDHKTPNDCL